MLVARSDILTVMLAMVFAVFLMVAVTETGGTVNIDWNFNVNPGVTRYVEVQHYWGHPVRSYWSTWSGYECRVYVYSDPYGYERMVYVRDGIVLYAGY